MRLDDSLSAATRAAVGRLGYHCSFGELLLENYGVVHVRSDRRFLTLTFSCFRACKCVSMFEGGAQQHSLPNLWCLAKVELRPV